MFQNTIAWLVQYSRELNVIVTGLVLAFAAVPLLHKPRLLRDHPTAWHAFSFWILQWVTLLLLYVLFPFLAVPDRLPWLLVVVDIQSVFALGFFRAFLDGKSYKPFPVWVGLLTIAGIVCGLDLGIGYSVAIHQPAGSEARLWWIAASEMLSATSLVLLGGIFVVRYGRLAIWILIATCLYGFLQRPVYSSLFVNLVTDARPLLALAVWKLVIGTLFYLYFSVPVSAYEPIRLQPVDAVVREYVSHWLKWILPALATLALLVLAEVVSRLT